MSKKNSLLQESLAADYGYHTICQQLSLLETNLFTDNNQLNFGEAPF